MKKPSGIMIFGASGAGSTTLGREIAQLLNFEHFDTDDYFFESSDTNFTKERPLQERQRLLLSAIKSPFVITGCLREWGGFIDDMFSLAIFIQTPQDVRLERLEKRDYTRSGERIRKGGDLYESHQKFLAYVSTYENGGMKTRSLASQEAWAKTLTCPIIRIDGTADYKETAKNIVEKYYTKPSEPWRVYTADLGELEKYRYTVIFARHGSNWLYSRHKERDTYETAGGGIEQGESPLECAKRELQEETGASKFFIHPAFDYAVHTDKSFAYGQVFYVDVETLDDLPSNSEMAEVRGFRTIPDKMTYPHILPVLYERLDKWLGKDKAESEYWDVLDENRKPTGRTHRRIDKLPPGDFHLVVRAWIVNNKGEILITRRAFNKMGWPGKWEIPSGSATAGEESLEAAIRETQEECGIILPAETAELFSTYRREHGAFHDNWLFRYDFDLSDIVLQENETIDARAATWSEVSAMMEQGKFIGRDVFLEFDVLEEIAK